MCLILHPPTEGQNRILRSAANRPSKLNSHFRGHKSFGVKQFPRKMRAETNLTPTPQVDAKLVYFQLKDSIEALILELQREKLKHPPFPVSLKHYAKKQAAKLVLGVTLATFGAVHFAGLVEFGVVRRFERWNWTGPHCAWKSLLAPRSKVSDFWPTCSRSRIRCRPC